jgi:hypothetical protein
MAVVAGLLLFVLRNGQGEANGLKKAPVERKSGGVFGPELRSFLRNRDVVLTCLTGFCGF